MAKDYYASLVFEIGTCRDPRQINKHLVVDRSPWIREGVVTVPKELTLFNIRQIANNSLRILYDTRSAASWLKYNTD